ncbi:hypothetical protein Ndes2526B_g05485 [Nannochloris sp. 'desiccata']
MTLHQIATASINAPVPVLGQVFDLTDINFDQHVNSSATSPPWLIEIYAPWCPACKDLEPVWQRLAADLGPGGILVGKIDGTKNRALMTRFSVRHFPSIYHITGVETREYSGRHTLQDLSAFAMGNWKKVEPRTGCASPVSRCGRLYGEIGKLPARGKAKYFELRDQKQYSDVSLFAGMLAVPVFLGLAVIASLDFYYSQRQFPRHLHQN